MKNNILAILTATTILSLSSCDSSGTSGPGNGGGSYDNSFTGTWIEVKGMQGPDNVDTISFSPDKISLGTVSTLDKYAVNGQIWEDYGGDKLYKYAYLLIGDTLWMDAYSVDEDAQAKAFNPLWANAFVKIEKYTAPAAVDASLIGNWIEARDGSYRDSLVISATVFEFHHGNSEALPEPILYGVNGPVFVKQGVIGETINGVDQINYGYRLVGDTLLLDACSSWCSEFSKDFQPAQKYVRY